MWYSLCVGFSGLCQVGGAVVLEKSVYWRPEEHHMEYRSVCLYVEYWREKIAQTFNGFELSMLIG